MKFRDHSAGSVKGEMQLAPMIDVVFLLLVFFIVNWTFAKFEAEVNIAVPEQQDQPDKVSDSPGDLVITVMEDGTVGVNTQRITKEELFVKLSRVAALFPGQPIILRGEEDTAFEHVMAVLDTCQKAGVWNVAFASFQQQPQAVR